MPLQDNEMKKLLENIEKNQKDFNDLFKTEIQSLNKNMKILSIS